MGTPITLRLKRKRELEELAEQLGRSQAQVADLAIGEMHAKVIDEARERARRGVALLGRLQERLGEKFWRDFGVQEVGFEADAAGRVAVHAGSTQFIESDGMLIAVRGRDGRTELAEVGEEGLGTWIPAMPGEPAMN